METSTKTFWKNESNVGLRSQKVWKQGRVVGTVRGMLMVKKAWKQGRVAVRDITHNSMHARLQHYIIPSFLHCSTIMLLLCKDAVVMHPQSYVYCHYNPPYFFICPHNPTLFQSSLRCQPYIASKMTCNSCTTHAVIIL